MQQKSKLKMSHKQTLHTTNDQMQQKSKLKMPHKDQMQQKSKLKMSHKQTLHTTNDQRKIIYNRKIELQKLRVWKTNENNSYLVKLDKKKTKKI